MIEEKKINRTGNIRDSEWNKI